MPRNEATSHVKSAESLQAHLVTDASTCGHTNLLIRQPNMLDYNFSRYAGLTGMGNEQSSHFLYPSDDHSGRLSFKHTDELADLNLCVDRSVSLMYQPPKCAIK